MTERDEDHAPDIRILLASTREQAELTHEQTMAACRDVIAVLEAELEAIDHGELPSEVARRFVNEMWSDFYAQKLDSASATASYLSESLGFIQSAPDPLQGAMVAADQALSLRAQTLELRTLELGFRIVAAVGKAGAG
jgi:hypothetical protein